MKSDIDRLVAAVNEIIVDKDHAVRLSVACILARGHLLIEDVPGVGKTTLSYTLAKTLGLSFRRIQFTSDLLPADILGNSIFDREKQVFVFHAGPIFCEVVLIDEVNRATPKTQSALLEAMEERRVSMDGKTHPLPSPFIVIATQNPQQQIGTFPLPESQLDRFLMRIELGVPDRAGERRMLQGRNRREMLEDLKAVVTAEELNAFQTAVDEVHASDALLDYLQDLVDESRRVHRPGLSPRASLALLHAAKAWAMMDGRKSVIPEDLQAVAVPVMAHRLTRDLTRQTESGHALATRILQTVAVP